MSAVSALYQAMEESNRLERELMEEQDRAFEAYYAEMAALEECEMIKQDKVD